MTTPLTVTTPLVDAAATYFAGPKAPCWTTTVGVPTDDAPTGPFDDGGGSAGWVAPTAIVFAVVLAAVVTVIVALRRRPPR